MYLHVTSGTVLGSSYVHTGDTRPNDMHDSYVIFWRKKGDGVLLPVRELYVAQNRNLKTYPRQIILQRGRKLYYKKYPATLVGQGTLTNLPNII